MRSDKTLEGLADADQLPRVVAALDEHWAAARGERAVAVARWPAAYRLTFGRDERGMRVVIGEASLTVALPCQRCLEAVEIVLECRSSLALIESETQAESLPDDLDPLVVGPEELLRPLDVVEDELLLALPLVPRHPEGRCAQATAYPDPGSLQDCGPGIGGGDTAPDNDPADAPRPNPFAALAALKNRTPPERDS